MCHSNKSAALGKTQNGRTRNSQAFGLRGSKQTVISYGFVKNGIVCFHGQQYTKNDLFVSMPKAKYGANQAFSPGL